MTEPSRDTIEPPPGFRSREAALFLAQLDDQSRRLVEDTGARAHVSGVVRRLSDADLGREVSRERPDGSRHLLTPRWTLYHLLEHEAGHYGQTLLLRHRQSRARQSAPAG